MGRGKTSYHVYAGDKLLRRFGGDTAAVKYAVSICHEHQYVHIYFVTNERKSIKHSWTKGRKVM